VAKRVGFDPPGFCDHNGFLDEVTFGLCKDPDGISFEEIFKSALNQFRV
jgi:hypothetical protein